MSTACYSIDQVINKRYRLEDSDFHQQCKTTIDTNDVLVLPEFLTQDAINHIKQEGEDKQNLAYFCQKTHNVYLTPPDQSLPDTHPYNRQVISSKGCITDDQISFNSPLRAVYNASVFRQFLCAVLGERQLYPYADPLSSINLHYARSGEQLGWHFDNSAFAITLLIQKPTSGAVFEYVPNVRNAHTSNDAILSNILDNKVSTKTLSLEAGALILFRGHHALHRVTPVGGLVTRMLVVLAYNTKPNVALSESAQMTFYGRIG